MELKNKRVMYDVEHQGATVKLSGSFTYTADSRITDLNGNFLDKSNDEFVGGFSYHEREGDLINKSTNSVKESLQNACDTILDEVIGLINTELTV